MNNHILNIEIQEFINNNLNSDVAKLLLKGTHFDSVSTKEIIEQIEAKKRCKTKLPTWFNSENIYYPNKLNIEQTSSEITAKYKSELIKGESIVDITGGFGVDSFYFSKCFKNVTHYEIDETLSQIVKHNYKQLGVDNITTIHSDGLEYLENNNQTFDCIYVDPSRRHDSKGKVFFLKDCLPNVPEHLEFLFSKSNCIMIKTSPLLDISIGINELKYVKTIHIIAVNNDVKELLLILDKNYNEEISLQTVNLKKESKDVFSFLQYEEQNAEIEYSKPLSYLYEPNSALLKAGGFNSISKQMNVYKLHKHSHLYTNNVLIEFPGRAFKIETTIPYNKKNLKKLGIEKANITTRNFQETVLQIRKRFNIKDGGQQYLFFTTNINNQKIVLICSKAK